MDPETKDAIGEIHWLTILTTIVSIGTFLAGCAGCFCR